MVIEATMQEHALAPLETVPVEQPVLPIEHVAQALTPEHLQQAHKWDWQKVTANGVEDLETLASLLHLDASVLNSIASANAFKLRVPLPFVARMRKGDINDPLLRQILPLNQEQHDSPELHHDPLDEQRYNVCQGLVHKYTNRVLLTATVSCPINCRYCFRRHFPYEENRITPGNWQPALDYIANDTRIKEVILSGGEPLLLNDRVLAKLITQIEAIEHIAHIRIHSRYPIVVPQRLTPELNQRLINSRCTVALVLHANHANEIDNHVEHYLQPLANSKVTLLNQSVLLKGINDNATTLSQLCEKMYSVGVLPYYLHATDPVVGTGHFQVKDSDAQKLALDLANSLPGYMVPTLVREISGKQGKTRLPFTSSADL